MNKKSLIAILIIVVVFIVGIYFAGKTKTIPDATAPAAEEAAVTTTVTTFGQQMKMVSLLAPEATLKESMETNYAPYVTPELLAAWEQTPANAAGRTVSSPWPDRIEVTAAVKNDDGTYTVTGTVVEVTSQESAGQAAATYPVTLTVENRNGTWLIASFEKGEYTHVDNANSSNTISVTGKYVCLPHRDTTGPQTMECAFGIQSTDGTYYAMDTSAVSTNPALTTQTGQTIIVSGTLVPVEALNSDQWQKYNIKGIIKVSTLKKL